MQRKISKNVKIILDQKLFLLEKGDIIIIEDDGDETPTQKLGDRRLSHLYRTLKRKAHPLARLACEHHRGDLFKLIMSDSDHMRQPLFLMSLMHEFSEKQRQILLDGLAREYADCDGWMEYAEQEIALTDEPEL